MLHLYNTALFPLRAVVGLWAAWHSSRPEGAAEWAERRARRLPVLPPQAVWLHGASVGEARIVRQLARELRRRRPDLPLAVSSTTRTGRAQLPAPPAVDAAFFPPLDFSGLPGRVLDTIRPAALVLVETELWPNLLHEAADRSVPVALVNGRLAPERMSRYRWLARLYRPLAGTLARVGAQTEEEARRLVEIGVRPSAVTITGNIKYDLLPARVEPALLRERFGLEVDRPVVVAGSTGPGEERLVFDAFLAARRAHAELFLVLAPRHPDRADEVEREATAKSVRLHRLSRGGERRAGSADGLLVDTLGELAGLYALGAAAFVGGSLVPIGGHNLLEPAALGVPVLFGPYTHHVAEPAAVLEQAGGALRVRSAEELGQAWKVLVSDPDRRRRMADAAGRVVQANGGALARSVDLVLSVLRPVPAAAVRPA